MRAEKGERATWLGRARETVLQEADALRATAEALDGEFEKAVELCSAALDRGGRIAVTGIGKNVAVAEKISATLASTGSTSFFINPVQALHGDIGMLADSDVLVAISFSGESEEVLRLLPFVRKRGIHVVGLAGRRGSSMGAMCDAELVIAASGECDPFNMAPTASTTATLALGDALAMVLLDIRGFGRDDYARLHPAGAIGRALLTRATDVMRTGDKLAVLPPSASIRDALVAMTRARAGATYVVGGDGRLSGIFTDGDLRRAIASEDIDLSLPLSRVMTPNPISAGDRMMATDILRIFQEHQIDDIPVIDPEGRLVGAIDISDLPKLKVL